MFSFMNSRKEKIWEAARDGNKKTISRLLSQATADDLQYEIDEDVYSISALIVAAFKGHLDIVQMLLQSNKVDVNQKSSKDGETALLLASKYGHHPVVEYLVEQGADIHLRWGGKTALMYASKYGHLPVVECLVQKGADIHQNIYGCTALMEASINDHLPVVEYLVQQGADVNAQNEYGYSTLMQTSFKGHLPVVQYLVQQGADINMQKNDGETALMYSSRKNHLPVVEYLVQQGTAINVQNMYGCTALMYASINDHLPIVEYLVQQGADIDIQDKDGETALLLASKYGHLPVVEYLVQQGADIHIQNMDDDTALLLACREGKDSVVKVLLQAGADKNKQNKKGETAPSLAKTEEIKTILVEYGLKDSKTLQSPPFNSAVEKTAEISHPLEKYCASNSHTVVQKPVKLFKPNELHTQADTLLSSAQNILSSNEISPTKAHTATPSPAETISPSPPSPVPAASFDDAVVAAPSPPSPVPAASFDDAAASPSPPSPVPAASFDDAAASPSPPFPVPAASFDDAAAAPSAPFPVPAASFDDAAATPSAPSPIPAAGSDAAVAAHSPLSSVPAASPDAVAAHSPPSPVPAASSDAVAVHGRHSPVPAASSDAATAAFTAEDRSALDSFLYSFPNNLSLQQVMHTVAAHDRTLNLLVSKQKECPSLFWFYPKQPKLRNWLSNPAMCLFQDTLMMMVVCPVTLCTVQCGPEGVGWEVNLPKKWVKRWGPAILFSVYVMQAAALAGRVVGIPLPPVPGAREVKEVLGLTGMLKSGMEDLQSTLSDSLRAFAAVTKETLDQTLELEELCAGLQRGTEQADKALPAELPMYLVDEAYKSIHTFLTTGENAKLGKLEDQLRGRMERVMAPDGDIEWVSMEGRHAWLDKHLALQTTSVPTPSIPVSNVAVHTVVAAASSSTPVSGWLALRLMERGMPSETAQHCHQQLVVVEGFHTEAAFARDEVITRDYLQSINITTRGVVAQLIDLQCELRAQYVSTPTTSATPSPIPATIAEAAIFTSDEKASMLQIQKTVDTLTSELNKLRASSAQAQQQQSPTGGPLRGGKGGLALQQAQCNVTNPRTRQPYTLDELAEEIHRLQKAQADCGDSVAKIQVATELCLEANSITLPATADKTAKNERERVKSL